MSASGPILVCANSPGEIVWVGALARAARQQNKSIEVLLLPCSFATGHEAAIARSMPGVVKVHPVSSYPSLLLWKGAAFHKGTTLIHLGGDLMYSAFLSWRWGWSCWSYLWARRWWDGAFRGYFSRDKASDAGLLRRKVEPAKIHTVGDLVVDTVLAEVPEPASVQKGLIAFMPGSRSEEMRVGVSLFMGTAEELHRLRPDLRFQLMVSPFLAGGLEVTRELLERLLTPEVDPRMGGVRARFEEPTGDGRYWLVSPTGVRMEVIYRDHMKALAPAELAISIPGTKTAEAATLGVPCLMVLPLNCPEMLPSHGLLGLLDFLPGGNKLKARLILRQRHRIGLLAQPNQRAGYALMPEMIDVLTPRMMAEKATNLLLSPGKLQEVRDKLRELYLPLQGAAVRMLALASGDA